MTIGQIIYAVLVAIHGLLFLIGLSFLITYLVKFITIKSDKLYLTALILWAISPIFSIMGMFLGKFL